MDRNMDLKNNDKNNGYYSSFLYDWPLPDDDEVEENSGRSIRFLIVCGILMIGLPLASALRTIDTRFGAVLVCLSIFLSGLVAYTDKSKKYPDEKYGSVLAMVTGLALLICPLLLRLIGLSSKARVDVLGLLTIVFGVMTVLLPVMADKRRKARCYYRAVATVVNICERQDSHNKVMMYAPLWQYEVYGTVYRKMGIPLTARFMKHEGDQTEFLLNPDSPHEMYQPLSVSVLFYGFVALCFIAGGVALIGHNHGFF